MNAKLSTQHLLGIRDLSKEDILTILNTTKDFKEILQRKIKKVPTLQGKTIVNFFFENSTRTRISFELAQKRLSADTIHFTSSNSSTSKGESLIDTVKNILSMKVDMVVIRHQSSGVPHFLANNINVPIINAGDGTNEHPTQALLDAFSILENCPSLEGMKILIIGDILHSRVAQSNLYLLTKMGADLMVSGPPSLIPTYIQQVHPVKVEYNLDKALQWCDVANVLRIQLERQNEPLFSTLREYNLSFGVTKKRIEKLDKKIIILHPGPINRGVEIDSEVADSDHSIILNQVENGVAVRMAILYLLSANKE
ncbi:MAG: aspartate carbamoyltransferase catalytic subunit [Sediminibacterium sp.]|nr:aspartate carbamoyltransferase catalytic subunit [Sediminibacterium sp.]